MPQRPVAEIPAVSEEASVKDWAGGLTLALVWGIPAAAMLAASFLEPSVRAAIWTLMLIWMGGACVANSRRCGRTHCRYTGPFFLVMAALIVAHATGLFPLGSHGWEILGVAAVIGNAIIWWGSERLLGTFRQRN
jgi:predicted MFS family arabinose efflux permease